jgi:hypothetical protein
MDAMERTESESKMETGMEYHGWEFCNCRRSFRGIYFLLPLFTFSFVYLI